MQWNKMVMCSISWKADWRQSHLWARHLPLPPSWGWPGCSWGRTCPPRCWRWWPDPGGCCPPASGSGRPASWSRCWRWTGSLPLSRPTWQRANSSGNRNPLKARIHSSNQLLWRWLLRLQSSSSGENTCLQSRESEGGSGVQSSGSDTSLHWQVSNGGALSLSLSLSLSLIHTKYFIILPHHPSLYTCHLPYGSQRPLTWVTH